MIPFAIASTEKRVLTFRWIGGLVLLLIFPAWLTAQTGNARNSLSVKTSYGIDMDRSHPNRSDNHLYGLHVSYDWRLTPENADWVRILNAQSLSLGLVWHNLSFMRELVDSTHYSGGQAIGTLAEVDFQLLRLGSTKLLFTPGLGISYITETIFTQPATSTIGSHINLSISGEISLEIPLSPHTSLLAGGSVHHYSNGGIAVPNGGWNALLGSMAIKSALGKSTPGDQEVYRHFESNHAEIWFGAGVRGRYRTKGDKFYRSGAYAGYNFYINKALLLKFGSHAVYHHTVFDPDRFDETFQYYGSSLERIRLGIAAGADFMLGPIVIHGMYGKYIHYRSYHNVQWYWVYGLRYFFTPNIGLQNTHLLHGAQADYMNWGIIFRI